MNRRNIFTYNIETKKIDFIFKIYLFIFKVKRYFKTQCLYLFY